MIGSVMYPQIKYKTSNYMEGNFCLMILVRDVNGSVLVRVHCGPKTINEKVDPEPEPYMGRGPGLGRE